MKKIDVLKKLEALEIEIESYVVQLGNPEDSDDPYLAELEACLRELLGLLKGAL